MKFKIGEKVRLRLDIPVDTLYSNGVTAVYHTALRRAAWGGRSMTIQKVWCNHPGFKPSYSVEENSLLWMEDMLQKEGGGANGADQDGQGEKRRDSELL